MSYVLDADADGEVGEANYRVYWYSVTYTHDGVDYTAKFKLNAPTESITVARVVFFLLGGTSADFTCTELTDEDGDGRYEPSGFHTEIAGLLASNDVIRTRALDEVSPATDPLITVQFNAPGRGDRSLVEGGTCAFSVHSDGDPAFVGTTPSNRAGDDANGEMTFAALEAVVAAVEEIIAATWPDLEIVKVISTHSNALVLGARLANSRGDIHALIDAEGPTDSLEQTVSTECFDPFLMFTSDVYGTNCGTLPTALTLRGWMTCTGLDGGLDQPLRAQQCGGHIKDGETSFEAAWGKFFRPPEDLLWFARLYRNNFGPLGQPAVNAGSGMDFDWSTVTSGEVEAFWSSRSALPYLEQRRTPYIRINCRDDHAQPRHYRNRHATRALLAAGSCGGSSCRPEDVYWLQTAQIGTTVEPIRFHSDGVDADTLGGLLVWPTTCGPQYDGKSWSSELAVPTLLAALVRWAFQQDFASMRTCVDRCAESPDCDDDDARLACVQACLATEQRLDPVTTETLAAWYGYATFACSGLWAAMEACADLYCDDMTNRQRCFNGALGEFGMLEDLFRAFAMEEYPLYFTDSYLPGCCPENDCFQSCIDHWCDDALSGPDESGSVAFRSSLDSCYSACISEECASGSSVLCAWLARTRLEQEGWTDAPDTLPCPATWSDCVDRCEGDPACEAWCTRLTTSTPERSTPGRLQPTRAALRSTSDTRPRVMSAR